MLTPSEVFAYWICGSTLAPLVAPARSLWRGQHSPPAPAPARTRPQPPPRHHHPVDLVRAVVDAAGAGLAVHPLQWGIAGDAQRPVHLDRPVDHVDQDARPP